jgi:Type IV pilin-like G and H, putative
VKEARARNFTSVLNRVSRAYFSQNERFTGDIDQLLKRFGSKPNSPNYDFSLALIDEKKAVQTIVVAKLEGLKSYTGLTYSSQSQGSATRSIVCESDRPTQDKPSAPELVNESAKCPSGYTQIDSRSSW